MADAIAAQPQAIRGRLFAWQGWRLHLPRRWDPVKLEGDAAEGYALFADALRPRLGLRWATPAGRRKPKFDAEAVVRVAVRREVGQLAAAEAKPCVVPGEWAASVLYVEPDPPGRDVWVGYSDVSGRLLTVAYHAHRREHLLESAVLPTLADAPLDAAATWAVFDLNCVVPGGMALARQQLNAGDLTLSFADRRGAQLAVRQVAVARLALQRQPLAKWVEDQQRPLLKHYRRGPTEVGGDGTAVARLTRRRRYRLAWHHPPALATVAYHDGPRDRLVLLHGTDESLLHVVAETVGNAM